VRNNERSMRSRYNMVGIT